MHRLIIAVLVLSSLFAIAASTFVPLPPLHAQPTAPAKPGGTWRTHACGDCVLTLAVTADAVWAGTHAAGVIRHDRRDGSIRQFTPADGLGGNAVREIAVGPDGDVWAATHGSYLVSRPTGISHYDGRTWRIYDTGDGLPDNYIVDIAPGKAGTAWIATRSAVASFDGQRWQAYTVADGIPLGDVNAVVLDGAGGAFVATEAGVAHFDGRRWGSLPVDGLPMPWMRGLALGVNGELWAIVGSGVGHYNPNGWTTTGEHWTFEDLGIPYIQTINYRREITFDTTGRLWIVQDVSAWRLDGEQWTRVRNAEQQVATVGAHPTQLRIDAEGGLWLSFNTRGIAHWEGGDRWTPLMSRIGPTSLIAFALAAGPGDTVWTGFFPLLDEDNYINRFDGTRWFGFSRVDGFPMARGPFGVQQNAIDADDSGTAWVGIDGLGIAWYNGRSWATKPITDVVGTGTRIRSIDADNRGGVWAGTGQGAVHFDGRTWRLLTTSDGLPLNNVQAVRVDPRPGSNVVWFGTDAGLTRWDGRTWRTFTTADGLASDRVFDIALDPRTGDLWLVSGPAGGGGVTRFDGRRGHVFTTADGLAANNAWDIEVDAWGEVWVATAEDNTPPGISRFDGRRWMTYSSADGLINDVAYDIAIDSKGSVWIATLVGVSEFRPDRVPAPDLTPTAEPEPGPCVCDIVQGRVPRAAIDAAVANPASVGGWQLPLDPGKPVGPFNPRRECLSLSRSSVPYHPLYNGLEWHAGCP